LVSAGTTNVIDQAFVTALGSKNHVKKGDGVSYAGNITIEAGALMVSANGDLCAPLQGCCESGTRTC